MDSPLEEMVMLYGVQIGESRPAPGWESDTVNIEYGAPLPGGGTTCSACATAAATRDDWWKWALGAGVVSVAAYALYQRYRG
jgi:hypothetical protein